MCHLRAATRSFRLDRIAEARQLAERLHAARRLRRAGASRAAIATLPRAYSATVLLKTDLQAARAHLFDAAGTFEQTDDGVLVRNQSDDLDWFARQLARLPFPFEIQEPPALREAVRACARRLLALADG
jgi:predicted DNA-binding transcriptional regulator YafY